MGCGFAAAPIQNLNAMKDNLCPFCPFADECEGARPGSDNSCPMFEDPDFRLTD